MIRYTLYCPKGKLCHVAHSCNQLKTINRQQDITVVHRDTVEKQVKYYTSPEEAIYEYICIENKTFQWYTKDGLMPVLEVSR